MTNLSKIQLCFFLIISFGQPYLFSESLKIHPATVIISNSRSIEYETIDKEKIKLIITIDGIKYIDTFYYAYYGENDYVEIPVPKYLSVYENSIIMIQGNGSSYRNIIVYQRENGKISKRCFENFLSLSTLPYTIEKYIMIYNQNPVLILNNPMDIVFLSMKRKIDKEISVIEIDSSKITIFFMDKNCEEITIDSFYLETEGNFTDDKTKSEFELIDVNFDGIKDLLIYLGNFGNQGVVYKDCFIWNNDIKMFENYNLFKNIQNPQIDENEKCIYGNSRNNSCHYEFELYTWDEKDLKCDFKIHKVYSALQLAELYKIDIPENKDAGEYMLEYFDIDKTLYGSVFYVKICYNKEEIKISKPSGEIFYELPEKLKELLSE